ncbi:MAG: phage protein Gp36 family protein [Candidatus Thorarchaeota archaeon]
MAYATTANIASEFKNITFDATSAVTDTEVSSFIEQEEAVIDATISNRYEVPITGTSALKILKSVSIAFVAYRVAKILNLKKDVPIPEKFNPQVLNEGSAFMKAKKTLSKIQSGGIVLNDAVARSLGQGIKSYNSENDIGPLWERDTKQW